MGKDNSEKTPSMRKIMIAIIIAVLIGIIAVCSKLAPIVVEVHRRVMPSGKLVEDIDSNSLEVDANEGQE